MFRVPPLSLDHRRTAAAQSPLWCRCSDAKRGPNVTLLSTVISGAGGVLSCRAPRFQRCLRVPWSPHHCLSRYSTRVPPSGRRTHRRLRHGAGLGCLRTAECGPDSASRTLPAPCGHVVTLTHGGAPSSVGLLTLAQAFTSFPAAIPFLSSLSTPSRHDAVSTTYPMSRGLVERRWYPGVVQNALCLFLALHALPARLCV